MKLVALLSWFDEDPGHLLELVRSLAAAEVDHLVAVDGPYALYPAAEVKSDEAQYIALRKVCESRGIALTLHTPTEPWRGNEVEKRNTLFSLGHALAEPYEDWLWVVDGDEVVEHAEGHRQALEQTKLDVATVLEWENGTPKRSERRLFRVHPKGIGVERAHFYYRNGDGDVLWGPRQVDAERLDIEVFHRPLGRSKARNEARNGYYAARQEHGAEMEVF